MTFAAAIENREARTANGMKARASTANKCVDLFAGIGAMRGKDVIPSFVGALTTNTDYAMRIAQWARDVREGSGERKLFRDILAYLAKNDVLKAEKLLGKVPELGRWDDLWSVFGINERLDKQIVDLVAVELEKGNGLLAKWLPRQKEIINGKDFTSALRNKLRMSPKEYRQLVVSNTKVVEQFMCAKNWDEINFSHVPSLAHSRYKKAFYKNAESYKAYVEALVKGDKSVKINAGAVYPYDVLKGVAYNSKVENDVVQAQWDALPNYLGDNSILPLVDVSGSMRCPAGGWQSKSGLTCLEVAVSLGLYVADKLTGDFKDCFLTFSSSPTMDVLKGNIIQKLQQISKCNWMGSTNLHAAFDSILKTAVKNKVNPEDMPKTLLIFSDMNFNQCVQHDDSAIEMIKRKYEEAGYEVPQVVFWNLNDSGHKPAKHDDKGIALVSGFSPSILRSILSAKSFTPEDVMKETILKERYDW
jgi:hypothetical protein